jgi:hypothetical protein
MKNRFDWIMAFVFRLRNQLDRKCSGINELPGNEFS